MLTTNDVIYLLDEGRECARRIRELGGKQSLDQTEARELSRARQTAAAVFGLGRESLYMLSYITEEIVTPFVCPEVRGRLAAMLNCNVSALMDEPDSHAAIAADFGLDPADALRHLATTAVHVAQLARGPAQDDFIDAMAREVRYYNKEKMLKAHTVLRSVAPTIAHHFGKLIELVEARRAALTKADIPTEEIPDEFLDPIMCELMKDPVELPVSHAVMDRSTISSHLLTTPEDPFNRAPLAMADLIPRPDIKQRIAEWLASRGASIG